MQRLEVSGAVRPIYESLGVKRLIYIERKTVITFLTEVFILNPKFDTEEQIGQDSSFSAPQDALYTREEGRRTCQKN